MSEATIDSVLSSLTDVDGGLTDTATTDLRVDDTGALWTRGTASPRLTGVVHKFGRISTLASGVSADVWMTAGTIIWQQTAQTLTVVSSGANAALDAAGQSGALTIKVEGLDGNLNAVTETFTMTGATPVVGGDTSQSFLRVYRAYVTSSGTYGGSVLGSNAGTILVTYTGTTDPALQISHDGTRGFGQSLFAAYTIPAGQVGYVASALVQVDGNKSADIMFWKRDDADDTTTPFAPRRLQLYLDGVSGSEPFKPVIPLGPYAAGTDLWFTALSGAVGTAIAVDFEIWLMDPSEPYATTPWAVS